MDHKTLKNRIRKFQLTHPFPKAQHSHSVLFVCHPLRAGVHGRLDCDAGGQ